ncbi:MAG TPA: glycosyltransferase, partial [Bryobacteraceae bacterium]|nr:glycosyltransferase [Bryobacteraceae bacterium]
EPRRILFIGSFAHLPNLLAAQFFISEIWPQVDGAMLHIIAGERHEFHLARSGVHFDLQQAGIEVEGFVPDVRPAYGRASIVIAPLRASAGTNIKILEAMAMAKPIVSTAAGVNGLDITPGEDFVLAETADAFALEVNRLLGAPAECRRLGEVARRKVERNYNWDAIARAQSELYSELLSASPLARS